MPGPDELDAFTTDGTTRDHAGKYVFRRNGDNLAMLHHPEAAYFSMQVGGFREDEKTRNGCSKSPIVPRAKLAAIISTLKAIRADPFAAESNGDPYLESVIEERREEETEYKRDGADKPTDAEVEDAPYLMNLDPYPYFIYFLDNVLQKCNEIGMDASFTHWIDV